MDDKKRESLSHPSPVHSVLFSRNNINRNKVHNKCNMLESSWNHPLATPSCPTSWKKLYLTKPILGPKKLGGYSVNVFRYASKRSSVQKHAIHTWNWRFYKHCEISDDPSVSNLPGYLSTVLSFCWFLVMVPSSHVCLVIFAMSCSFGQYLGRIFES